MVAGRAGRVAAQWSRGRWAGVLVTCMVAGSGSVAAEPSAIASDVFPRVRFMDDKLRQLAAESRDVPTLRALLNRLSTSDVIVYVGATHRMDAGLAGKLRFVSMAGSFRVLSVMVDASLPPALRLSVLAHELQHACEVAGESGVRSERDLRSLYRRIGQRAAHGTRYETEAARAAGRRFLAEIAT